MLWPLIVAAAYAPPPMAMNSATAATTMLAEGHLRRRLSASKGFIAPPPLFAVGIPPLGVSRSPSGNWRTPRHVEPTPAALQKKGGSPIVGTARVDSGPITRSSVRTPTLRRIEVERMVGYPLVTSVVCI